MAKSEQAFLKLQAEIASYEGDEPYIFISYSHHDTEAVYDVLRLLEQENFRFWYDDTMEIGEDFREELRTKIENCSAFLFFVSEASMRSKYCGMEIITAYKHDKKIFPFYLSDDVELPAALKMILENLQHVKGFLGDGSLRYVKKMITGLPIETMRTLQIEDGELKKCKDGSRSIVIPNTVTAVGESAFKNCEKLEDITVGSSVRVMGRESFRGCKNLQRLVLPQNVQDVGESAFRDCIGLTECVVENEGIEIGERAFENCASLKDVRLQAGMTEIYGGVFNSCKSLEYIDLPEMLTILGESCFADCASLKEVSIPPHVTKIDDMVFNGCIGMESITLNDSLMKIGKNAFKDCRSLKSVYIPRSVVTMGVSPFRGCCSLESITVDPKSRFFKSVDSVLFNKNKSALICYPSKIDSKEYFIPDSVTVIGDWAFCECVRLERVVIPDSVYEIGEGAF